MRLLDTIKSPADLKALSVEQLPQLAQEIRDAAIEEGMLTLRMDGWRKVLAGITTLEEVIRVTSEDEA